MSSAIQFDPIRLPREAEELRLEVRDFLAQEIANGGFDPHRTIMKSGFDREFSKRVGARGWIGMTWPKKYGGHEKFSREIRRYRRIQKPKCSCDIPFYC